jgi:hypothetical protein
MLAAADQVLAGHSQESRKAVLGQGMGPFCLARSRIERDQFRKV